MSSSEVYGDPLPSEVPTKRLIMAMYQLLVLERAMMSLKE